MSLTTYPEKADVGGSTPSLATIILKSLAGSPLALPVRSQSASVCGVAENRSQPVSRFSVAQSVEIL
jgi:hypothetical protein